MASILFTKQLLQDAIVGGDYRSAYMYGLRADGTYTSVSGTFYSGIPHNHPFLTSASVAHVSTPAKNLAGGPAGFTKLFIYGGDRPDISSIVDLTAYDGQRLISFNVPTYSNARGSTGLYLEDGSNTDYQGFKAICGICPTLTTAVASGVATWFFFGSALSTTEAQAFSSNFTGN